MPLGGKAGRNPVDEVWKRPVLTLVELPKLLGNRTGLSCKYEKYIYIFINFIHVINRRKPNFLILGFKYLHSLYRTTF